jgi:uncharacterized BrkB/YihY/UPF0761 family membrane protein
MSDPHGTVLAEDALLGLLLPFWQLVIGLFVVVALVAAVYRLGRRGPSRMRTALLVTGGAIVGITLVGILTQGGP